jgi:acetyltransferase-like isoleucine patch superfamily enzyme
VRASLPKDQADRVGGGEPHDALSLQNRMTTKTTWNMVVNPPNHLVPFEDPLRLLPRSLTKLYSIWVSLTYPFACKGHNLSIHYTCDLLRSKAHRIKLGNSVQIRKDSIINVALPPEQNGEPIIVIDDNTSISLRCMLSAKNCIHIERDVMIAQSVLIIDHAYAHEDGTPRTYERGVTEGGRIRIGQGSWIGQGAAIVSTRGELVLGRNCVVAANAVVTRSFPSHSVIFGDPARIIRQFDPAKKAWVLGFVRSEETDLRK